MWKCKLINEFIIKIGKQSPKKTEKEHKKLEEGNKSKNGN